MFNFASRNLKVFFKDKTAVFFSLLAVFIIIGLYALFLGDVWVDAFNNVEGIRYVMDSWIMSGLLAVTSITTTLGAFGIMIEDRHRKIIKDFVASPIKRSHLVGGYMLSAFLIGVILSLLTLVLAQFYIVSNGGRWLNAGTLLKLIGCILVINLASTSMIAFLVSFFKSMKGFSTASSIVGTLVGFLTGIYIPIGNLPEYVQQVIKCFPISYGASLLRQIMMEDALSIAFKGAPVEIVDEFKVFLGVDLLYQDTVVSPGTSILILLVSSAVFFVLALIRFSHKQKD